MNRTTHTVVVLGMLLALAAAALAAAGMAGGTYPDAFERAVNARNASLPTDAFERAFAAHEAALLAVASPGPNHQPRFGAAAEFVAAEERIRHGRSGSAGGAEEQLDTRCRVEAESGRSAHGISGVRASALGR